MSKILRAARNFPPAAAVFACLAVFALSTLTSASAARPSARSATRGLIVYWSDAPFPSIWAIRPDGRRRHRILHNRQNAKRPRLSHDRRWVAFDGAPRGKPILGDFDVQIVRLDGSQRRTLTNASDWDIDAQWSPDDGTLSFTRIPEGGGELHELSVWTVRRDGSGLRSLGQGNHARWSPDGRHLVFTAPTAESLGDLFVMDADGSGRRLLLASPQLDAPTAWSRNGKKILFTRWLRERDGRICVMNADGTGLRKLARGWAGTWSPDGSRIVYVHDFQLYVMKTDGSAKRRLSTVPAWDPDWR